MRPVDLQNMKALANPPEPVRQVGIILLLFKPFGTESESEGWNGARQMMNDPGKMLQKLLTYSDRIGSVTAGQIAKIKKIIENKDNRLAEIKSISEPAEGLYKWSLATMNLYDVNKKVEPLKKKVENLQEKARISQEELIQTEKLLEDLDEKLKVLNARRVEKEAKLKDLTDEANAMARRLNAAKKLIQGLGREKTRWTADRQNLLVQILKLIGDCLTCSSFLSYAGPFDFNFRKKMVYEHWRQDIVVTRLLPNSETFRLEDLLTTEVEISQWASETLPTDELSV